MKVFSISLHMDIKYAYEYETLVEYSPYTQVQAHKWCTLHCVIWKISYSETVSELRTFIVMNTNIYVCMYVRWFIISDWVGSNFHLIIELLMRFLLLKLTEARNKSKECFENETSLDLFLFFLFLQWPRLSSFVYLLFHFCCDLSGKS